MPPSDKKKVQRQIKIRNSVTNVFAVAVAVVGNRLRRSKNNKKLVLELIRSLIPSLERENQERNLSLSSKNYTQ